MTDDDAEETSSFAAVVGRLRNGETVDPAEIRRLRDELRARARRNAELIGRAGGMDAKTAKKTAKELERDVSRLRRPGEG